MMVRIKSKYKKIYTTDKRYIILTGGRGSGKTFVVKDFLLRLLEQKGQGILYTRFTMTSVETTIVPLFTKYIEQIGDLRNYHITKTRITHKRTGSFLMFSGIKTSSGDQTGRLKSLPNITTWVIEEGEDFQNENTFTDIDDSIRTKDMPNRVIWIQNPTTSEHFIYKKFFENSSKLEICEEAGHKSDNTPYYYQKSTHPEVEHIHTTYYDNKENLDASKVAQWEKVKLNNPTKWQHKYLGAWLDSREGVIFKDWREGAFDTSLPYGYGQDYGFSVDPTTLIKAAVNEKKKIVYLQEMFYSTLLNEKAMGTKDIYNVNLSKIENPNDLIIADSQEGRLILDLQREGLNIHQCEKGPGSVKAGILSLQDYTLVVTEDSYNIKKELKNYIWNDKKAGIPIDDYNHAMDAIRYIFRRLTNKKGVIAVKRKKRKR